MNLKLKHDKTEICYSYSLHRKEPLKNDGKVTIVKIFFINNKFDKSEIFNLSKANSNNYNMLELSSIIFEKVKKIESEKFLTSEHSSTMKFKPLSPKVMS